MSIGVSMNVCPRHHVAIKPYSACEECMREDPVVKPVDTQRFLMKRWGVDLSSALWAELPLAVQASRTHLPAICRELDFTKGAEIGVWKAAYAVTFCQANPAMHMLCVDPWESYPAWRDTKNTSDDKADAQMAEAHAAAVARLKGHNATIVRKYSGDAAKDVPDGSLDLLYVDGNHGYDAVMEDLTLWVPKVRPSGLVAGHDYRVFAKKPFIHVVRAVTDYTKSHGIDPWFVLAADRTPSFLWVKQ